jgi:hypothetical protein
MESEHETHTNAELWQEQSIHVYGSGKGIDREFRQGSPSPRMFFSNTRGRRWDWTHAVNCTQVQAVRPLNLIHSRRHYPIHKSDKTLEKTKYRPTFSLTQMENLQKIFTLLIMMFESMADLICDGEPNKICDIRSMWHCVCSLDDHIMTKFSVDAFLKTRSFIKSWIKTL